MRIESLLLATTAALLPLLGAPAVHAQITYPAGIAPVSIPYTCAKTGDAATGVNVACTTTYTVPSGQYLVVQNVSGAMTQNAGFTSNQIDIAITTNLGSGDVTSYIGPTYDIANTTMWYFNAPTTLYSQAVPVVASPVTGKVVLQGFVVDK